MENIVLIIIASLCLAAILVLLLIVLLRKPIKTEPQNLDSKEPNEETLAAMQEAEDIASDKIKSKGYDDVDEMIQDILKDED